MQKRFAVKINWLPFEKGGRKEIPSSEKYAPVIQVKPYNPNPEEYWSAIVVNRIIVNERESFANIEYLSDNAPDNLEKDVEFELYEGSKLVAEGVVIQQVQ